MGRPTTPRALTPVLLLLALTGCGTEEATEPAGAGAAGGACLTGATECADIPTGTGGAVSGPDGSLPVADVVAVQADGGIDGGFLVSGYYVAAGDEARLCEALLESFPPQCGGDSLPLDTSGTAVQADTRTEGDVTWSEERISVEGQLVDGVFVVGSP